MMDIKASADKYETWLRAQVAPDFVEADLDKKHDAMRKDKFVFLRATYWRWAEIILTVCPDLARIPQVLAIGDIHLENFGTWRDEDGRLVWGVNDFDEAADMPWALDLVRLAASALLADDNGPSAADIVRAIDAGYRKAINNPCPFILDRDHRWLRQMVVLPEAERTHFWDKFAGDPVDIPKKFSDALARDFPTPHTDLRQFPRTAGTGSLGRPRFVATAEWFGGPVVREVKILVPSGWTLANAPADTRIRTAEIATGLFRSVDPHYRAIDNLIVRRLAPNSRKIDVKDAAGDLTSSDMLAAMGHEMANCHASDPARRAAIAADIATRDPEWLKDAARAAAQAVEQDFHAFR
jgi:hypothetical protein